MNIKRRKEIVEEIYQNMFAESIPPVDYYKLKEYGVTNFFGWQSNYILNADRQLEIIDEICKKYKCNDTERQLIYHLIMYNGTTPLFTEGDFGNE
jgi:hypothetical protein